MTSISFSFHFISFCFVFFLFLAETLSWYKDDEVGFKLIKETWGHVTGHVSGMKWKDKSFCVWLYFCIRETQTIFAGNMSP